MKTIEETAKELYQLDVIPKSDRIPERFIEAIEKSNSIKNLEIDAFKAGVEFAQRWIPVEEELPPPEESVLVKDCFGKHRVSVLMYDMKTWKTISMSDGRVTHWRPIELK